MVWTNTLYAMWTRSKQKLTLDDKLDENTNPNNSTRRKIKVRKNNYEKQLKLEISAN